MIRLACFFFVIFAWSDADHDLLEPPWQWGRIIAISLAIVVFLVAHVLDSIRGGGDGY